MAKRIPLFITNPMDGTRMALIPGGWFQMGAEDGDEGASDYEKPRHLHYVAPFYMALYCVTVEQFGRFVKETGYSGGDFPEAGSYHRQRWGKWKQTPPLHPVGDVNCQDINAYSRWAGLRLPTEAEWELAARGHEGRKYPWGNDWEKGRRVCWGRQKGPTGSTWPVSSLPKGVSPFGMAHMSGNVRQWCADRFGWGIYQQYSRGDFTPATRWWGHMSRGTSWSSFSPGDFRCTKRDDNNPWSRDHALGFRLARTL